MVRDIDLYPHRIGQGQIKRSKRRRGYGCLEGKVNASSAVIGGDESKL